MKDKIGVGIITYNRPDFFHKCYKSLPDYIDNIVVVNDGDTFEYKATKNTSTILTRGKNVGYAKNVAMRHLLNNNCDYIFTMEDDIEIIDKQIFKKYIDAYKATGIHHFNFGFSQRENLDTNLNPVYRKIVDYGNTKIILTQNILGAFTFYTRTALQSIGMHYYKFNKGHGDHLELTYRAYKLGFATPFWWFADLYGSWDMIKNLSNMSDDSKVRKPETFWTNFNEASDNFKYLHGYDIFKIPQLSEVEVVTHLKELKKRNE